MIKLNNQIIEQNRFPDGTLFIKPEYKSVHLIDTIIWNYENDAELFTLICLTNFLRDKGTIDIVLEIPYLPHARMDRVKNSEDVFTLKYFCAIINSLNFYEVWVRDVHSNVALALLDRVHQMPIDKHISGALNKIIYLETGSTMHEDRMKVYDNLITFFPDEGAMKRYSTETNFPYAFGIKKRDWETGEIKGLDIMNKELVQGKNVLIIDDICSKGGTFYYSAKALKEAGAANIYLYITHCENTVFEGELLKDNNLIKHIFTTDSILTKEHEKITII